MNNHTNPTLPKQMKAKQEQTSIDISLNDMEKFLREKHDEKPKQVDKIYPMNVVTQNTFFSNFSPISAVPFRRGFSQNILTASMGGTASFDFFQIPPRRFLLANSLSCKLYTQYDTGPIVLGTPLGDDALFQFGFGFSLSGNQLNNAFLSAFNYGISFTSTTAQTLTGSYTVFNQNALANGTQAPAYLMFSENQSLSLNINWGSFPTGANFPPDPTYGVFRGILPIFNVSGYLINSTDYYRFLDSINTLDLKDDHKSTK